MRKINKIINIAVIFMLSMGVVEAVGQTLRVPIGREETIDRLEYTAISIKEVDPQDYVYYAKKLRELAIEQTNSKEYFESLALDLELAVTTKGKSDLLVAFIATDIDGNVLGVRTLRKPQYMKKLGLYIVRGEDVVKEELRTEKNQSSLKLRIGSRLRKTALLWLIENKYEAYVFLAQGDNDASIKSMENVCVELGLEFKRTSPRIFHENAKDRHYLIELKGKQDVLKRAKLEDFTPSTGKAGWEKISPKGSLASGEKITGKTAKVNEKVLIQKTKDLEQAMKIYMEGAASGRQLFATMLMIGMYDKSIIEESLVETYRNFMKKIDAFLRSYAGDGVQITYVYPLMGPDIIPLITNETIGINNDPQDFNRGFAILDRALSYNDLNSVRPVLYKYRDEHQYQKLNAMDINSYIKVAKSIKGVKVLILKGFDTWTKEHHKRKIVDKLLKNVFDNILQEGDIILILNKEDVNRFESLVQASGFSLIGPRENNLLDGILGVNEDRKILEMPTAIAIMQKKEQAIPISKTIKSFNKSTDL